MNIQRESEGKGSNLLVADRANLTEQAFALPSNEKPLYSREYGRSLGTEQN
jgi:hypothetical protein